MLLDIYSVHKALLFRHCNFAEYTTADFVRDIERAETDDVKWTGFASNLSLYPSFIVDDDLFAILDIQFLVNNIVNDLKDDQIGASLAIQCYVVPKAVHLLWDPQIRSQNKDEVADIIAYLKGEGVKVRLCGIGALQKQFQEIATREATTIVVLVDRRCHDAAKAIVFECDDFAAFLEMRNIHFIGVEYEVSCGQKRKTERTARAWLNLGNQQRLRFFPEHLVSVLPRLFAKSGNVKQYRFLQRVYGDAFKHGVSTDLGDAMFVKYYKIITGTDHVAVNYQRRSLEENEHNAQVHRLGFIAYLKDKLDAKHFSGLDAYLIANHFDSDALFADVLQEEEKTDRVYVDQGSSNIASMLCEQQADLAEDRFMRVKLSMFDYKKIKCTVTHVLNLADCPHLHQVVENLKKFKEHMYDIDAANVSEFNLSAVLGLRSFGDCAQPVVARE